MEFGTAGYTLNDVFVLYDRSSDSVWYPGEDETLNAVAGAKIGSSIKFLEEPDPQPLADWLALHPDSMILLPSEDDWLTLKRPRTGLRFKSDAPALVIRRVVVDGPADQAGLEADDVVLSVDGQLVTTTDELNGFLDAAKAGDVIELRYERGEKPFETVLTLDPPREH